jgi:phage baseplate assembly protein gpV
MSHNKAYVVATHPESYSVDLVMAHNGMRMVGVPVMAGPGTSARTGSVDLPDVPASADQWDITKRNGQDIEAAVGWMNGQPFVTGFFFPQINQVLPKSATGARIDRHRSDVIKTMDADGNWQIAWPNGTYLRVGESPDSASVETANASAADRNTGKRLHVRLGLAGGAFVLTITPDGACTMVAKQDFTIQTDANVSVTAKGSATVHADGDATVDAGGNANVQAGSTATVKGASIVLDGPVLATQSVAVSGALSFGGGLSGSAGAGGGAAVQVNGGAQFTQDVVAAGISLQNHKHTGVQPGGGQTGTPAS